MNNAQLRPISDEQMILMLEAALADKSGRIKSAYREVLEMWLAQNAAKSAIQEAA